MSVKLTYFDLRGRAETSRLVLHAAKKSFIDHRLEHEDWPIFKPETPFGFLPVMEIEGERFSHGMAIATFLAKECGLYSSDGMECLEIDQIHQLREDLLIEEVKTHFQEDSAKKVKLTANMKENVYPRFLSYFDKLITLNKSEKKSDFAVGETLTLADIVIFEGTQTIFQSDPATLEKYSEIMRIRKLVEQTDGIKQYLAMRKRTEL